MLGIKRIGDSAGPLTKTDLLLARMPGLKRDRFPASLRPLAGRTPTAAVLGVVA